MIVGQLGCIRRCALVVTIELTWLTDRDERAASIALVWAEAPCRTQHWYGPIHAISRRKLFAPALTWDACPVYGARTECLGIAVTSEPPCAGVKAVRSGRARFSEGSWRRF